LDLELDQKKPTDGIILIGALLKTATDLTSAEREFLRRARRDLKMQVRNAAEIEILIDQMLDGFLENTKFLIEFQNRGRMFSTAEVNQWFRTWDNLRRVRGRLIKLAPRVARLPRYRLPTNPRELLGLDT
jgi:hypothetical protein